MFVTCVTGISRELKKMKHPNSNHTIDKWTNEKTVLRIRNVNGRYKYENGQHPQPPGKHAAEQHSHFIFPESEQLSLT